MYVYGFDCATSALCMFTTKCDWCQLPARCLALLCQARCHLVPVTVSLTAVTVNGSVVFFGDNRQHWTVRGWIIHAVLGMDPERCRSLT
jgi:hypothetical protein